MPRNFYDKAAFTDLPAAYDKDTPIEENYGSDANKCVAPKKIVHPVEHRKK